MTKSQKIAILLILSILCAFAAGFGIYKYCNSTKGFIYIFNADYSAGTKIEKSMFKSMKVDYQIIETGQKSNIETYYVTGDNFQKVLNSNEYLLNDVVKDQPLTFTDLAFTSGSSIERSLSGDNMAVTISISGAAAVTDQLRVGSYVNIYTTSSMGTVLVFENMKIIARNQGNTVSTITFETSPDDALDLINVSNNNRLYFSLLPPVIDENAHSGYVERSIQETFTSPTFSDDSVAEMPQTASE